MSTTREDHAKPAMQVVVHHTFRFAWLTFAMACGIAALLAAEAVVLWRLGIDYLPKMSVSAAGVSDFTIDDTGRWAISRIVYMRQSKDASLQSEVLLHDLRQPDQPILLGPVAHPRQLVISARTNRYAIGCYDGSIYTGCAQPDAAPLQRLACLGQGVSYQLACSADGRVLAAADTDNIYLWRIPDGKLLWRMPHTSGSMKVLAFSSDTQSLLSLGGAGHVCLWNVSAGQLQYSHELHEEVEQAILATDGRSVTLVLAGGTLHRRILNLETGELRLLESKIARRIDGPLAISRDGATIATVNYASTAGYCLELWDADTGERVEEVWGGEGNVNGLRFAADGTLYCWDSKGGISAWSVTERRPTWSFSARQWAQDVLTDRVSLLGWQDRQVSRCSEVAVCSVPAPTYFFP